MVTKIELAAEAISATRKDATIGLLACGLDIAEALDTQLGIGDGSLEWKVVEGQAATALRLNPSFYAPDIKGRRAKGLRGHKILRSR